MDPCYQTILCSKTLLGNMQGLYKLPYKSKAKIIFITLLLIKKNFPCK
ncbi:hypothetical protein ACIAD1304 [Acinetobacter baylyi ADP1]|uniref:Uncharacterized protein n=1 Tax=Acinetobacter baylyi (strain ATCC 33305 / BD413 / ADP1) TaxID=62977 RepID=Q6FCN4_ACIAD|nr:hypothetical protein ACIAD1304 [Acinetobacter baylyi ADP1]